MKFDDDGGDTSPMSMVFYMLSILVKVVLHKFSVRSDYFFLQKSSKQAPNFLPLAISFFSGFPAIFCRYSGTQGTFRYEFLQEVRSVSEHYQIIIKKVIDGRYSIISILNVDLFHFARQQAIGLQFCLVAENPQDYHLECSKGYTLRKVQHFLQNRSPYAIYHIFSTALILTNNMRKIS